MSSYKFPCPHCSQRLDAYARYRHGVPKLETPDTPRPGEF